MANTAEKQFERSLNSLAEISSFMEEFFAETGIGEANRFTVFFILEELFTNSVKYSPEGTNLIIRLRRDGDELIINLMDHNVDRFDVTQAPEVDIHAPLEKRRVGGLGIHLIRKFASEIAYEYADRSSRITVKTRLET